MLRTTRRGHHRFGVLLGAACFVVCAGCSNPTHEHGPSGSTSRAYPRTWGWRVCDESSWISNHGS